MTERYLQITFAGISQSKLSMNRGPVVCVLNQPGQPTDGLVEAVDPNQELCESETCTPVIRFPIDRLAILRFGEFETSFAMMRSGLINEKIDGHDKGRHKP